jgi:glycosyltransferase involved in cell wall biosynthesis
MKILHVTKKYPRAIGGDAVVVSNLERQQVRNGHKTAILTSCCDSIDADGHVYTFGFKNTVEGLDRITYKRLLSLPMLFVKAFAVMGREKPDIIHTHSIDLTFFVSFAARCYRIPIVHTFHIVSFNDRQQSLLRRKTELLLLRGSNVRAVTAPNAYEVRSLRQAGVRNVHLLFNGIDPVDWPFRRVKHGNAGVFRFIAVGRMEKQKGYSNLIRALAQLVATSARPFHLTIVGCGSEYFNLASLIEDLGLEDRVALVGPLSPESVRALYAESDALVISSLWETTPLTLLEAWVTGLPVICTPVGILRDETYDRVAVMTRSLTTEALSSKMLLALSDEELLDRVSRNGLREVGDKYVWPAIASQLQDLYVDTLS